MSVISFPVATGKAAILAQLRKDLLKMDECKSAASGIAAKIKPGPINNALPGNLFPVSAVHEFICGRAEDAAATVVLFPVFKNTHA
jgi:protein ImuA